MQPQRILVVDDHAETLEMMGLLLEKQGRTVFCASTAAQAIALVREQRFELGLLDLSLPELTGFSLLQELRAVQNFPCIALTGAGTEDDIERSLAAGFCRHVLKPCPMAQLEQIIAECLAPPMNAAGSPLLPAE